MVTTRNQSIAPLLLFALSALAIRSATGESTPTTDAPPTEHETNVVQSPPHLPDTFDSDLRTPLPRIVGGSQAVPGEFPGVVSLQNLRGSHFCGGTLLDARHVLTAAHCMTDESGRVRSATTIQVMGADLSILSAGSGQRQVRRVSHIFVHTQYNLRTMRNDISVVRVQTPFLFNGTFHAIGLAASTPPVGQPCAVAGWGATVENGTASARLQRMTVEVIARSTCNQRQSYNGLVQNGMICAGTMRGGRDSCQGDSGGGLMCNGYIAGVVSFGFGCARPNFPGVYADASVQHAFVQFAMGWNGTSATVPVPTTVRPSAATSAGATLALVVTAAAALLLNVR